MKIRNLVISIALVGVTLATGLIATAKVEAAPGDTATCKYIPLTDLGKGFTKGTNAQGDTISTRIKVEGDSNCRKDFVLAAFKIPGKDGNPYPLEDQKLFHFSTLKNVKPGTYKLTVNVPKCYHQVDLALGLKPTGPNGQIPYEPGRLLNAYLGGNEKCTKEKPVGVVCLALTASKSLVQPKEQIVFTATGSAKNAHILSYIFKVNDKVVQSELSYIYNFTAENDGSYKVSVTIHTDKGDFTSNECVNTVTVIRKDTPPTVLPNTGAGNIMGIFFSTTIAGAMSHRIFLSRRSARS